MATLTAFLPLHQAATVKDALDAAADVALAAGVATSRGQVRADTLVARVTALDGASGEIAITQPSHPVRINLIMTDVALLDHGTEPA